MSSEGSLDYNGPLSTYSEWHSTLIGLAAGIAIGWSRTIRRELRREPHYVIGFFLIGAVVTWALTTDYQ